MYDPVTIGLISLGVAGAGAGYSGYESYKAAKTTEEAAKKAEEEAAKLEEETAVNEASATMATLAAKRKKRATSTRDTVLTGNLGLIDQPTTTNKTLLGQ